MKNLSQQFYAWLQATVEYNRQHEEGATAVEYGMIVALIAAVIVAIVATLGGKINTAFTTISSKLP
jgi:pilus assembly protein Flp/PilA